MTDSVEVIVSTDNSDLFCTISVWDPKSGNQLMVYRGGGAATSSALSFINYDYLVAANAAKPLIHIWPVNSQEQLQTARFVMPGRVNALCTSSDGNYLVAGIAELVYVWHIPTGKMFASLSRHYQPVNVVQFTDDNSHFVSAGQDGMVLVWSLADVLSIGDRATVTPKYSFSDHTLPVTGLKIGLGGSRAMLYTVSMDRTCRIYDLAQGNQLMTLVCDVGLTSLAVDRMESKIFVGTSKGEILEFNLTPAPRMMEYHLEEKDLKKKYIAHTGSVTCLSLSMDNETLLSGGQDQQLLVWHIVSKQILRTIPHKGALSNAFFTITPPNMFHSERKLNLITGTFQRVLETADNLNDIVVRIVVKEPVPDRSYGNGIDVGSSTPDSNDDELHRLRHEVKKLQEANTLLYSHIVEQRSK